MSVLNLLITDNLIQKVVLFTSLIGSLGSDPLPQLFLNFIIKYVLFLWHPGMKLARARVSYRDDFFISYRVTS